MLQTFSFCHVFVLFLVVAIFNLFAEMKICFNATVIRLWSKYFREIQVEMWSEIIIFIAKVHNYQVNIGKL
jgi:hypothetical protein